MHRITAIAAVGAASLQLGPGTRRDKAGWAGSDVFGEVKIRGPAFR